MSTVTDELNPQVDPLLALYDQKYVQKYLQQPASRLARLIPLLNLQPTDSVGDFGCGAGLLLDYLNTGVAYYYGIDFAQPFIEVAKKRAALKGYKNYEFVCSDIQSFCNSRPSSLDKALTFDFSEHIDDKTFQDCYGAIYKSLVPGGQLFLHTPNGDYFIELLKQAGVLRQFPEHIGVRSAARYLQMLTDIGFSNISVSYLAHYVQPLKSLSWLARLPFVGNLFAARLLISCTRC